MESQLLTMRSRFVMVVPSHRSDDCTKSLPHSTHHNTNCRLATQKCDINVSVRTIFGVKDGCTVPPSKDRDLPISPMFGQSTTIFGAPNVSASISSLKT